MSCRVWRLPLLRWKTSSSNSPDGGCAIERRLDTHENTHAAGAAESRLHFLQPGVSADLSLPVFGTFRAQQCRRRALYAGVGAVADGHGQLLGTEHAAGNLPRAGHFAEVSADAGGRRS